MGQDILKQEGGGISPIVAQGRYCDEGEYLGEERRTRQYLRVRV